MDVNIVLTNILDFDKQNLSCRDPNVQSRGEGAESWYIFISILNSMIIEYGHVSIISHFCHQFSNFIYPCVGRRPSERVMLSQPLTHPAPRRIAPTMLQSKDDQHPRHRHYHHCLRS